MNRIPSEFTIGGVYLPPLLIAAVLGVVAAILTAKLLDRTGFARFFVHPELAYLGMVVIYTGLIGLFVIPV
jgi:hypothetical protein